MRKMTVLLADDNEDFCKIVEKYLNKQPDIDFLEAIHNGAEALQRIKEIKPDIAILDGAMPGLDGLGILEKLNKEESRPICIMLSGIRNETVTNRAYDLGAEYYIIKPFELDTLAERIRMFKDTSQSDHKGNISPSSLKPSLPTQNIEERVTDILNKIGIPAKVLGYRYLRMGITMTVEDMQLLNNLSRDLYPAIAKAFKTTPTSVERAIRHALDIVWKRESIDTINKIFEWPVKRPNSRATNGEIIALIADKLRLEANQTKL